MASIKYQLESTRPTIIQIAVMLCAAGISLAIALSGEFSPGSLHPLIRPFPEVMPYIAWAGVALFTLGFLLALQRYFARQNPLEIETSEQLIIKYENGKIDRIPYRKIFRCVVMEQGRPNILSPVFRFFLGPPTLFFIEVKPARFFPVADSKIAEKICNDINSKVPPGQPDLAPHPLP